MKVHIVLLVVVVVLVVDGVGGEGREGGRELIQSMMSCLINFQ